MLPESESKDDMPCSRPTAKDNEAGPSHAPGVITISSSSNPGSDDDFNIYLQRLD